MPIMQSLSGNCEAEPGPDSSNKIEIELILADATGATDSTNEKFRMELVLVGVIVLWLTNKWMVFHSDKKIHANIKSFNFPLSMVICNEFSAEDEQTD